LKILIVCSKNSGRVAPFILEQGEALRRAGVEIDYFGIEGKGWRGYLRNRKGMLNKINQFKPQLIHAHYSLSGLLANTQRSIPVVTTYHGSDINDKKVFPLSKINMWLSVYNIFVSKKNRLKSGVTKKQSLIPCGVDLEKFIPMEKNTTREMLGLELNQKQVLFAGAFDNAVKNPDLAKEATSKIENLNLLELKNYSREEVALLMNAVDVCLMTSFTEGSPQFIKEAMACNCPVVSVPVGDVPEVLEGVAGCYIADYDAADVAEKLIRALNYGKRTEGRQRIIERGIDSETVAKRILEIYAGIVMNYEL